MFTFLHAADIHLDSPLRGLERYEGAPVEAIRGATRRAFENLVTLALEERVAFVVLVGDLYDGDWKDYNTGLFFSHQMARLHAAGIGVYVVAGNHDAASQLTRALRPPPNVHVFATATPQTCTLPEFGVALHGQGYATREVTTDLSQAYPPALPGLCNVGLLHTSLDGRPGHAPYAPCSVAGLAARGYQYWALGHVHQHEIVARAPWIVFPGNVQGRHARETGAKGAVLVSVADTDIAAVEHRALDVVRWSVATVDIGACATLDDVYAAAQQALATSVEEAAGRLAAVRLRLVGAGPLHERLHQRHEQVVNQCRALAVTFGAEALWLEKIERTTRPAHTELDALARDDAFGELLRTVRDLELDDAWLAAQVADLAELTRRLPPAVRADDAVDAFDPSDPAQIRGALDAVKALLVARLLEDAADP